MMISNTRTQQSCPPFTYIMTITTPDINSTNDTEEERLFQTSPKLRISVILKQPFKQLEKENEHENENENENKMHVHASTSTAGRDGNAKAMDANADANELSASRNEIVRGNGVNENGI